MPPSDAKLGLFICDVVGQISPLGQLLLFKLTWSNNKNNIFHVRKLIFPSASGVSLWFVGLS